MRPRFRYTPEPVLEPVPGCEWASKMVLNPAIVKDPASDRLHMLFRATGPWSRKRKEGKHDPYPIFLGYAASSDLGRTWTADFSRPAIAPALNERYEDIYITDINGNRVRDYSNGCIEDPRIFPVEGELYLSAACRLFPPGPYWLIDREPPVDTRNDYVPEWVHEGDDPFRVTACSNPTVTVLYKLDLDKLKAGSYEEAFAYVCPLTEGYVSDNRDAFLFPNKMLIGGKLQYVMLHRPMTAALFPQGARAKKPSIYLAAAEKLQDFACGRVTHRLLATCIFHWEEDRIGASWAPLQISAGEWLVSYHGKKDASFGYTQSFMILREQDNDFPVVAHRCSERLMYASQEWEMPSDYPTPCLFTTGGIVIGDDLIMSYGAADQKAGISWVNFAELVEYIKQFDAEGRKVEKKRY
ncbi:hypothetical protein [Paenibacillus sp. LHD-38]|uniref:glycoside hydrolase family 130 protein n=1 Tax=Paenibacillus sp. LHD-38 TaxID=3072143 RepID=UPI00280CE0D6|nr:hypothetical protein [Paenibacillus sp. LHD-38]MDQ8739165.1 hypothetical protein [Paenibacillus sp. LHD-38]